MVTLCGTLRLLLNRTSVCPMKLSALYTTGTPLTEDNKKNIRDSYNILQIPDDSDLELVRESYLKLAKEYHPDSGSAVADARYFARVEQAYRTLVKHHQKVANKQQLTEEAEQTDFDIHHIAPQHRQYLNYEGVGFGTPSKRELQYQQYKARRAAENVTEYQVSKISAKYENSMVTKDKALTRKKNIRNAMDRLVEDLIAESMSKGDFDNLPGSGKPLTYTSHNPMIDTATHNLNKILIENGYAPQWVNLQKEISQGVQEARQTLLESRIRAGKEPLSAQKKKTWDKSIEIFRENLDLINNKVNKLNMIVPSFYQQIIPYDANKEITKTLNTYNCMISKGEISDKPQEEIVFEPLDPNDKVRLKDIIREIRSLFSS